MSTPTFRIGTLMGAIAIIAVVLALVLRAPGIAALLTVPGCISLVSTLTGTKRSDGQPPTLWDYLVRFLLSFTTVCLVFIASGAAFFATCLGVISMKPGAYGGPWMGWGLFLGAVVGVAVLMGLSIFVASWRDARRERPPSAGKLSR